MLQCTPAAAATLEEVRERNAIPDDYGIRVFAARSDSGDVSLGLSFTPEPMEGDQITEQHGTTIIVAPEISEQLDDLMLDVVPDPSTNGQTEPQLVLRSARDD